jgi:hypothetical protein
MRAGPIVMVAIVLAWVSPMSTVSEAEQPAVASPGLVASLVRRVGATFAAESHGVIAFRSHAVVRTSPHFVRADQVDDAWIVDLDGRAVHIRSGDATGPATTEAGIHQPYDARYTSEYRYAFAPCGECTAGSVAVAYDSDAHDGAHGRGVMVVDERTARVVRVTAQPFVVPRPATAGTLTTTWGATAAGWLPIAADGSFTGRIGPFGGHATLTQAFTGYKRYPDIASAERAGVSP